jgi:hypothetical protein
MGLLSALKLKFASLAMRSSQPPSMDIYPNNSEISVRFRKEFLAKEVETTLNELFNLENLEAETTKQNVNSL